MAEKTTLRVVCMYCRKIMGYKDGKGVSGDSHSICQVCWEERFPDSPYPSSKPENQPFVISYYDNMVRHLGYDPGELNELQKVELVEDSQRRLAGVKPLADSELTPSQLSSLNMARAITGRKIHAANIPAASDRVTTAGMYSRSNQEIYISPMQLGRGREAVSTAIHELAHHTSGAEDGEPEHATEISTLANQVVAGARRGDFDRYLSGAFTW